jgi:hypothetical protein
MKVRRAACRGRAVAARCASVSCSTRNFGGPRRVMSVGRTSLLRGRTLVAQLREILEREGIRGSCSADQEGFFFAIEGPDEVSLQYNLSEDKSASPGATSSQKARNDLVRCCSVIADLGFAVTLILSPRTLALFVRSEGESLKPR